MHEVPVERGAVLLLFADVEVDVGRAAPSELADHHRRADRALVAPIPQHEDVLAPARVGDLSAETSARMPRVARAAPAGRRAGSRCRGNVRARTGFRGARAWQLGSRSRRAWSRTFGADARRSGMRSRSKCNFRTAVRSKLRRCAPSLSGSAPPRSRSMATSSAESPRAPGLSRRRQARRRPTPTGWRKLAGLRVFEDDGRHDVAYVGEAGGAVLVVSQFTLYGDVRRGRRPSFDGAAEPGAAERATSRCARGSRRHGLQCPQDAFAP